MHKLYRNVNEAFTDLVTIFRDRDDQEVNIVKRPSRAGDVLQIAEPVTITYTHPRERVLFNPERDANQFFHLYESLWMLAGREDVKPLEYYNSRMSEFSDDGVKFNGAYGYRWRKHFGYDQLEWITDELRANLNSRRCVLQMWDSGSVCDNGEPREGSGDLYLGFHGSKDVPCNTCAFFLINDGRLDMTVCNRSNDLIWGLLGANVVHFSILQEYLAAHLGVEVGVYNQFTNNLHAYTERFNPELWLKSGRDGSYGDGLSYPKSKPLVLDPKVFDQELPKFVDKNQGPAVLSTYQEPFLQTVAQPMCQAFYSHKLKNGAAMDWVYRIAADDWRLACQQWIEGRMK